MRAPSHMVFDRALTPQLLDVALRVASQAHGSPAARRLLTVALRDHVSDQESQGKTKKCLSRIWVKPPADAKAMIDWAIDHQEFDPPHTVLHLGAILATFPFASAVIAIVGRQLRLEGRVDPQAVKAAARQRFGDRSTIEIGARKVITTLRYLGLLVGDDGGPFSLGDEPVVPPQLTGWMSHALLLARQMSAIGIDELARAPELALVKVAPGWDEAYPLLDLHNEANRTVAAVRG